MLCLTISAGQKFPESMTASSILVSFMRLHLNSGWSWKRRRLEYLVPAGPLSVSLGACPCDFAHALWISHSMTTSGLLYKCYSVLKLAFSYVFILSVFVCVHARLCVCVCVSCSVVPDSLTPHGLWPARLLCPWDSPGRNTGVGCHSLPQGIFLTQRWNLCLLYCRQIFTI